MLDGASESRGSADGWPRISPSPCWRFILKIALKSESLTRWFGRTKVRAIRIVANEPSMTEDELLERITIDPTIFGGKPIIRGMRIAVEHVVGMLAAGDSPERLLQEYSFLEPADIQACLTYAHRSLSGEAVQERIALKATI
jgi:uncharacterized protein (DUF433 family)